MRVGKWVFKEAQEEKLSSLIFAGVRLRIGQTKGLRLAVLSTSSVTGSVTEPVCLSVPQFPFCAVWIMSPLVPGSL